MTVVRHLFSATVMLALSGSLLVAQTPAKKDGSLPDKVSYYKDVRPIFMQHCQGCHQPAKAQGGFIMSNYKELFNKGDHEVPGIVSGQPDKSMVVMQILPQEG